MSSDPSAGLINNNFITFQIWPFQSNYNIFNMKII